MSVTDCRSCGGAITFIRTVNDRWRPVEVTFEELEPSGTEILVSQEVGCWAELSSQTVRIYKAHACPEDPTWNRGRPRMRHGNEETGELLEGSDALSDPRPSPPNDGLTWQERILLERKGTWLRRYVIAAKYPCTECDAAPGEACVNAYGQTASSPHRPRHIATFFDEDDETQPWPPLRHNQRGTHIMRNWLAQNANVLTGEEE